jgi:hypothetical protein
MHFHAVSSVSEPPARVTSFIAVSPEDVLGVVAPLAAPAPGIKAGTNGSESRFRKL